MPVQIALTRGLFALVDEADATELLRHKWHAMRGGSGWYACRSDGALMHRELLNPPDELWVDHADGNGLNNTRANIRVCNRFQNAQNARKRRLTKYAFKGIEKYGRAFRAVIRQNGERLYLGVFDRPEAAARQYDRAARVFFGKFAKTNEDLGLYDEHERQMARAGRRA